MTRIRFTSPINLTAAKAGKPRRFSILAYSGGKIVVAGFAYPVVVDLAGLETPNAIPILIDHEQSVDATLGRTDSIVNDGRSLSLSGLITGQSPKAKQVIAQSAAGHTWQASIGAAVELQETVPDGERVSVNGQTFIGPVIIARRSVLRETSVLPVAADSTTSVNLAARAAAKTESSIMPTFEEWAASNGFDATSLTPEALAFLQSLYDQESMTPAAGSPVASAVGLSDLRASRAADHDRIARIEALTFGHPAIAATAIRAGWTPDQAENAVLKAKLNMPAPSNWMRHSGNGGGPDLTQVLCASFALSAGAAPAHLAKSYGQTVVDAAACIESRGATLRNVMDHVLQAAGVASPSNRITDAYIRAAFQASQKLEASGMSTVSLPGILGNAANKLLLQGYESVQTTWQEFCAIGELKDFKTATRYRMTASGAFEELGPGGVMKSGSLTNQDAYTNKLKTYARMVALSRQDIINDDLGAFEQIPASLGRQAVIKLEKVVYTALLANAASFFHANNSNYLTGANSVLDIGALTDAEKLFLLRTDANGDPVMLMPALMLVPPALSVTANQLVRDTQVVAVGVGGTASVTPGGNPHAGRFTVAVSPWLENTGLTGYSSVGWYLLARPQGASGLIDVGFLNGQRTPIIEDGDLDFSQLGLALRGYWDFGVAMQDGRYGVFNLGS